MPQIPMPLASHFLMSIWQYTHALAYPAHTPVEPGMVDVCQDRQVLIDELLPEWDEKWANITQVRK